MNSIDQVLSLLKDPMVMAFGGGLLSLLVSFIVKVDWPSWAKEAVAVVTCVVAAFVGCLGLGIDVTNIPVMVPAMFMGMHLAYRWIWKPRGIALWLETLFPGN